MHEWTNGHRLMKATYCKDCPYAWIVEEYRWDKKWRKTARYWKFNTLDEVKTHVIAELF